MTNSKKIDTYIEKHIRWSDQLTALRNIFNKTEIKEEVKKVYYPILIISLSQN